MTPYYERDCITLFHGDCREILPSLPPADLVWTSPPYGQQRDYGKPITDWDALMLPTFRAINAKQDTQVLVNLGMIHREGEVVTYWDHWIEDMRAQGWRRFGWYVWDQGSGMPGNWNGRLGPSHEFIFHFNRAARVVNKTVECKYANVKRSMSASMRDKGGKTKVFTQLGVPIQERKIADSVIRVTRYVASGVDIGHPAIFPVDLAREVIAAFTAKDELVVEPFAGSGTSLLAAWQLGRRAIGCELEEQYCEIVAKRLEQHEAPLFEHLATDAHEQLGLM